jgi:hypothetical protein
MAIWDWLRQADRPQAIRLLAAAAIVVLIGMWAVGRDTTRQGGPSVVAFALAGSEEDTRKILQRWGSRGQRAAKRSLWTDYLFLLLYTMLLSLACAYLAIVAKDSSFWPWLAAFLSWLGTILAWVALLGGMADAVENTALLVQLPNHPSATAARIARLAAQAKFLIIGGCLLYVGLVRGFSWLFVPGH